MNSVKISGTYRVTAPHFSSAPKHPVYSCTLKVFTLYSSICRFSANQVKVLKCLNEGDWTRLWFRDFHLLFWKRLQFCKLLQSHFIELVVWAVKSHMSRIVKPSWDPAPPPIMWFVQVTWLKVWTGISWCDKGSWWRSYLMMTSFLPNSLKRWPFSFRMHSWVLSRWFSSVFLTDCASSLVFGSCQPKWALTFVTLINHMMKRALLSQWATPWFRLLLSWSFMSHKVGQWLQGAVPPVGSRHQFIELKKLLKLEVKHLHGPKRSVCLHFQFLRQGCRTYSRRAVCFVAFPPDMVIHTTPK